MANWLIKSRYSFLWYFLLKHLPNTLLVWHLHFLETWGHSCLIQSSIVTLFILAILHISSTVTHFVLIHDTMLHQNNVGASTPIILPTPQVTCIYWNHVSSSPTMTLSSWTFWAALMQSFTSWHLSFCQKQFSEEHASINIKESTTSEAHGSDGLCNLEVVVNWSRFLIPIPTCTWE